VAGRWFSPGTPEKKTDRNDITEIFVESCSKSNYHTITTMMVLFVVDKDKVVSKISTFT
jgi:hypothetical protein